MTKQQAIGLRPRNLFSNKEKIEDFSALNYFIDFYFPKYKLIIEFDELGHKDRDQTKENKKQKDLKEHLNANLLELIPTKKNLIFMIGSKNY